MLEGNRRGVPGSAPGTTPTTGPWPSQGPKYSDPRSSLTDGGDHARRFVISGVSAWGTSEAVGSDPTQAAFFRRCPTHLSQLSKSSSCSRGSHSLLLAPGLGAQQCWPPELVSEPDSVTLISMHRRPWKLLGETLWKDCQETHTVDHFLSIGRPGP